MKQAKWDRRFIGSAAFVAGWSKDPSTKVGAVITDPGNRVLSQGFNGFAKGIDDSETRLTNRAIKYRLAIHAETNAILFAQRSLEGCTIYSWPIPPCAACASLIAQVGIVRVVSVPPSKDAISRWGDDLKLAQDIYAEAGIEYVQVDLDE